MPVLKSLSATLKQTLRILVRFTHFIARLEIFFVTSAKTFSNASTDRIAPRAQVDAASAPALDTTT